MAAGATTTESSTEIGHGRYLGEDLIFVISQPRSGSTLLQRMLAGHSWIQTSAETWLMLHPVYGLRRRGITTDYRAPWAVGAITEFLDQYANGRETYLDGIRAFAQTVYGTAMARGGRRRFLDKTPRYTMIVPELIELFPAARFILLLRNPLAVLSSELKTYVRGDWKTLANFATDLVDAPARIVAANERFADRVLQVRYEELVQRPEEELKRICRYLDLPWEPGMEDYSQTPAPKGIANDPVGIHRHARPSTDSLETWRALGQNEQTRHFALAYLDSVGDGVVSKMGYDPQALKDAITAEVVTTGARGVFPWSIAIRPSSAWSLRDKITASYYEAAAERGPLAGSFTVAGMLLKRLGNGLKRLLGFYEAPSSESVRPGSKAKRDDA